MHCTVLSKPNIFFLPTWAPCPQEERVVSYIIFPLNQGVASQICTPKVKNYTKETPLGTHNCTELPVQYTQIVQLYTQIVQLYSQIVQLYTQIVQLYTQLLYRIYVPKVKSAQKSTFFQLPTWIHCTIYDILYSTGTIQYSTVRCKASPVQHSTIRDSTVQYRVYDIPYNTGTGCTGTEHDKESTKCYLV